MSRDPELQRLIDESAVRNLIQKYSRALDRHDNELLASLFHPDAVDLHGHYNGSASGFVEWMKAGEQPGVHWMHHLGTQIIEMHSETLAHSETYCLAICRRPDTGKLARLAGAASSGGAGNREDILLRVRYLDRVEKRAGEWKIAHRRVVYGPCTIIDFKEEFPLVPEMLRDAGVGVDPAYSWPA